MALPRGWGWWDRVRATEVQYDKNCPTVMYDWRGPGQLEGASTRTASRRSRRPLCCGRSRRRGRSTVSVSSLRPYVCAGCGTLAAMTRGAWPSTRTVTTATSLARLATAVGQGHRSKHSRSVQCTCSDIARRALAIERPVAPSSRTGTPWPLTPAPGSCPIVGCRHAVLAPSPHPRPLRLLPPRSIRHARRPGAPFSFGGAARRRRRGLYQQILNACGFPGVPVGCVIATDGTLPCT